MPVHIIASREGKTKSRENNNKWQRNVFRPSHASTNPRGWGGFGFHEYSLILDPARCLNIFLCIHIALEEVYQHHKV